jgi:hypothetical protein
MFPWIYVISCVIFSDSRCAKNYGRAPSQWSRTATELHDDVLSTRLGIHIFLAELDEDDECYRWTLGLHVNGYP